MHALPKQVILFFVGPDMTGKTQISQEVARVMGIPYFKASSEHDSFLSSRVSKREAFLNQLRYADPRVFDILKQTGYSLIFDRGFPCEYAYSKVFGRETDMTMLRHMDEMWSTIDARIIMCYRSNYDNIVDDLDPMIKGNVLQQIHDAYLDFFEWSKCKRFKLNVDDEDLNREVNDVIQYLRETTHTHG
jgi:deoxyadenosine/deoxycytidine kinase